MNTTSLKDCLLPPSGAGQPTLAADALLVKFRRISELRHDRAWWTFFGLMTFMLFIMNFEALAAGRPFNIGAFIFYITVMPVGWKTGKWRQRQQSVPEIVRFAGMTEAANLFLLGSMLALGGLFLLMKADLLPRLPVSRTTLYLCSIVTIPGLAGIFYWAGKRLARRWDPDWWD